MADGAGDHGWPTLPARRSSTFGARALGAAIAGGGRASPIPTRQRGLGNRVRFRAAAGTRC